ncbi:MAG: hypothetical protein GOVbin1573_55 [Prokaryotic dsDNA virus sp.]|nr:MAG: hypothetical protein GOVbin1573_55 [Prokaryotic dsDNA virus sp.]|tara:strand:+ start:3816 stop:4028 length:213 start_codon:yes stop_codon:yes gene_type:complete
MAEIMCPDDVLARLDEIRRSIGDPEGAHSLEDKLRGDLLRAIATEHCSDPMECARLAMTSDALDFPRWCA